MNPSRSTPRRLVTLALAAGAAVAVALPAGAATTLRWKFEKDKVYHYSVSQTSRQSTELGGQKQEIKSERTFDYTWKVQDVATDGNARIAATIDRIRIVDNTPFGKSELDTQTSQDSVSPGPAAFYRAMTGQPVTLRITPRGQITDVELPDSLLEAIKKAAPPNAAEGLDESTQKSLKEMLGKSSLVLPENAIEPGQTWKSTLDSKDPLGTTVVENTYTYRGPANTGGTRVETITLDSTLSITPVENSPVQVSIQSQKSTGSFQFDNAAGYLTSSEVKQTMRLVVKGQGMEAVQDVESSGTMKATRAAAGAATNRSDSPKNRPAP